MSLYWRLSGVYLFYFASIGAFIPFWGLYLAHAGFTPFEIGTLMAIQLGTKVAAPPIWGWIADHSGMRVRLIRTTSILTAVCFSGTLMEPGFAVMALVMALFGLFWNASLPVFEAATLEQLGASVHRYSRIRLWGSVGFVVSAVALGPFFERFGMEAMPWIFLALLAAIWVSTLLIGDDRAAGHHAGPPPPVLDVLRRPEVVSLLAACFFLQASMGPYYAFFSLYLEGHGYSRTVIGPLWAIGVVAEIGVFLVMHRWLPRFGAARLLIVAMALTTLRWVLVATAADHMPVLIFAQILHAASYGIYHAAAIHLIFQYFPGRLQARGQALYGSIAFGLGNAVGSFLAGIVWDGLGPMWIYLMGALLAGVGTAITWWSVRGNSTTTS